MASGTDGDRFIPSPKSKQGEHRDTPVELQLHDFDDITEDHESEAVSGRIVADEALSSGVCSVEGISVMQYAKVQCEYAIRNWSNGMSYESLQNLEIFRESLLRLNQRDALEKLKNARKNLIKVIEYFCHYEEDASKNKEFVRHMQAILFKTFLDEGHEEVDATVMGAHAGEEEESMFEAIARSGMEGIQGHPCFAAVVQYKWNKGYSKWIHWLMMFFIYLPFMASLMTALVLAAHSRHPLQYNGVEGGVRATCEALCLLYAIMWLLVFIWKQLSWFQSHSSKGGLVTSPVERKRNACETICYRTWKRLTVRFVFDICRILAVLLIIPFRLADSDIQWVFASIAVICNGLKVLHYFAVLSYIGRYVATLIILVQKDFLWIVGVFVVLNFSIGGGLYLALQGHNNPNDYSTNNGSDIYTVWVSGFQLAAETTSTEFGHLNWFAVIIYAAFVFTITIIFGSIVTAQFTTIYAESTTQAGVFVVLNKCRIIMHIEDCAKIICNCEALQCLLEKSSCGDDIENYKQLPTPYTYAGIDPRPASVLLMKQKHQELIKYIHAKMSDLQEFIKEELQKQLKEIKKYQECEKIERAQ